MPFAVPAQALGDQLQLLPSHQKSALLAIARCAHCGAIATQQAYGVPPYAQPHTIQTQ